MNNKQNSHFNSFCMHTSGPIGAGRRSRQLIKVGIQLTRCLMRFPVLSNFLTDFVEVNRVCHPGANLTNAEQIGRHLFIGGMPVMGLCGGDIVYYYWRNLFYKDPTPCILTHTLTQLTDHLPTYFMLYRTSVLIKTKCYANCLLHHGEMAR